MKEGTGTVHPRPHLRCAIVLCYFIISSSSWGEPQVAEVKPLLSVQVFFKNISLAPHIHNYSYSSPRSPVR